MRNRRPWHQTARPYFMVLALVVGIVQWPLYASGSTSLLMALLMSAAMGSNVWIMGPWPRARG